MTAGSNDHKFQEEEIHHEETKNTKKNRNPNDFLVFPFVLFVSSWFSFSGFLLQVRKREERMIPRRNRKTKIARWFWAVLLGSTLCGGALAQTAAVKVDSETISGLGARNIGSAAMSGPLAALDAGPEGQPFEGYIRLANAGRG